MLSVSGGCQRLCKPTGPYSGQCSPFSPSGAQAGWRNRPKSTESAREMEISIEPGERPGEAEIMLEVGWGSLVRDDYTRFEKLWFEL